MSARGIYCRDCLGKLICELLKLNQHGFWYPPSSVAMTVMLCQGVSSRSRSWVVLMTPLMDSISKYTSLSSHPLDEIPKYRIESMNTAWAFPSFTPLHHGCGIKSKASWDGHDYPKACIAIHDWVMKPGQLHVWRDLRQDFSTLQAQPKGTF